MINLTDYQELTRDQKDAVKFSFERWFPSAEFTDRTHFKGKFQKEMGFKEEVHSLMDKWKVYFMLARYYASRVKNTGRVPTTAAVAAAPAPTTPMGKPPGPKASPGSAGNSYLFYSKSRTC